MKRSMILPVKQLFLSMVVACLLLSGCNDSTTLYQVGACPVVPTVTPNPPPGIVCNNTLLTDYDELLIITPHPDDEVLGFAGLMLEFLRLGKPVRIFVVTIGDAYCDACSFWKNVGIEPVMQKWAQCSEAELAEFATIRKGETTSGQQVLGGPTPTFWGYPDTGISTVWTAYNSGVGIDTKMHRSDCTKSSVFGAGSEINVTPRTMYNQLYDLISKSSAKTLIGTTHPLDGHPDHNGLGNMIRKVNADLAATGKPETAPKSVAFTVIHANTTPAGMPDHDTWYPYPGAIDGRCFDPLKQSCYETSTSLLTIMRSYRYHPEWPFPMPQDVDYVAAIPGGVEVPFCLPTSTWQGANASKLLAVQKFISQQGFLAKTGTIPRGMGGLVDCNGYQLGFVRSNEMFVLEPR